MRTCATEWKQAQATGTTGGEAWPQFLAQCRTRQGSAAAPSSSTAAPAPSPQSGSLFPWSQPSTPTSTAASNVGAPAGGQSVMQIMREPMERRQGRRNDRRPDVAAVSVAMPRAPNLHRFVLGKFCSRAGPCPSRSCLAVRISIPLVATVGALFLFRSRIEWRRARRPAGGPIHNGARGARPLPVGHRRVGQHADAHLPLLGNPVLWAYAQGRIYVRG